MTDSAFPSSSDAKEEIRSRIDIADFVGRYVRLKPSGQNLKGLCPFHKEKTPSFFVNPERASFHCFGCGKGGDVFTFVQETEGLDFRGALELLAEEAGVSLKTTPAPSESRRIDFPSKSEMLAIHRLAARFFYRQIKQAPAAIDYFKSRGLQAETVRELALGYAPKGWSNLTDFASSEGIAATALVASGLALQKTKDSQPYDRFRDRIIFTLFDISGKPIAFAGRALEEDTQPKYLNSPETPIYRKSRILYGLHKARPFIEESDAVIVVEGYMDFLSLYQAGIRNVVATSGTALTPEHGQVIRRFTSRVIVVFDGDAAGIAAAERAVFVFAPYNLDVRILILSQEEDPDSFVRKSGAEALRTLIGEAEDGFSFILEKAVADYNGETPRGQPEVLSRLKPFLEATGEPILVREFVKKIAERLRITEPLAYGKLNMTSPLSIRKQARATGHQHYEGTLEGNFIRILVSNPRLIDEARQYIRPETLTDAFSSHLYSIVIGTYEQDPELVSILDRIDDIDTKRVVSSLMVREGPAEQSDDDLIHTVIRLQAKFLRSKMREIKVRLEREPENRDRLLLKQKELSTQLKELDKKG